MPKLLFTPKAAEQFRELENFPALAKRFRAVRSALGKMEHSLRHPSLRTHVYDEKGCPHDGKLFEAYAENNTPVAYRIFFCYMPRPDIDTVLIVAITPHP